MAWSRLQSAAAVSGTGGTGSVAYGTNLSSSSVLIACISLDTDNASAVALSAVYTVKDTAGNTFTYIGGVIESGNLFVGMYALATPSGDVGTKPTITATINSTVSNGGADVFGWAMLIQEVSGISVTTDGTFAGNDGASASVSTGSYSSTAANEYLLVVYGDDGEGTTPGSGNVSTYTADANNQINTTSNPEIGLYYKNSSNGTETFTATTASNDIWGTLIVAFKLAASGPITPVQQNEGNVTSTSIPVSLGAGVTLGNLVVVCMSEGNTVAPGLPSARWNQVEATAPTETSLLTQMFYLVVTASDAGATSFTFTLSASHSIAWTIREWNSTTGWLPQATVLDVFQDSTNTSSATLQTGTTGATAQASELAVAALGWASSGQTQSGLTSGYTSGELGASSGNNSMQEAYQVLTTTGTQACQVTLSAAEEVAGIIATFKPAAAAAGAAAILPWIKSQFPPSFYVKRHNAQGMKRRWRPRQPAIMTPASSGNPKFATLIDNFESNDLSVLWGATVGNVVWSSGQVAIEVDTSYDSQLITTAANLYDLTSSYVYVQVSPYVAGSSATTLNLTSGGGANGMFCGQSGNNFTMYKIIGGVQTNLNNVTWNPGTMAWWQIIESGGTISFQTAPDGVTWTTQFSTSDSTFTGTTLTAMSAAIVCGDFGSDPVGTSYVYRVNTNSAHQFSSSLPAAVSTFVNLPNRIFGRAISAIATATGSMTRKISRALAATLVTLGVVTRSIGRTIAATIVAAANIATTIIPGTHQYFLTVGATIVATVSTQRKIGRILAGIAAVTGTLGRSINRALSAVAVIYGTVIRSVSRPLAGVTVVNASVTRRAGRTLIGVVVLTSSAVRNVSRVLTAVTVITGSVSRSLSKVISSVVVLTAAVTRSVSRSLSATIVATASLVRSIMRSIVAVVVLAASTVTQKLKQVTLNAVVVVTSSVSRQVGRPLSAVVVTTGTITRSISRTMNAVVILAAAVPRQINRTFILVTVITGSLIRQCEKMFTSVTVLTSSLTRSIGKLIVSAITVTGTVTRGIYRACIAVVALVPTLTAIKTKFVTLVAAVVATATLTRTVGKPIVGLVALNTSITRLIVRLITPVTTLTVTVTRNITRTLTATTVLAATTLMTKLKMLTLVAATVITASTTRSIGKLIIGIITITSSTVRSCGKGVSSLVSLTGSLTRSITRTITSTIVVTSSTALQKFKQITLQATAVTVATTTRFINFHLLPALMGVIASPVRQCQRVIGSVLVITGSLTRTVGRNLTSVVVLNASTAMLKVRGVILTCTTVVTAATSRKVLPIISAVATIASSTTRGISRSIQGTFAVAGQTVRQMGRGCAAGMVATSQVTRQIGRNLNVPIAVTLVLSRFTGYIVATGISVSSAVTRNIRKSITATATFVVSVATGGAAFFMTLTTSLAINPTVSVLRSAVEIVFRKGTVALRWIVGSVSGRWKT